MATPDPVLQTAEPGDLVGIKVKCPRGDCNWSEPWASAVVVNEYGVKDPIPSRCPHHDHLVDVAEIVEVVK